MTKLDFNNKAELHKHFSIHCFNKAWELIENKNRTNEETKEMVQYALAGNI